MLKVLVVDDEPKVRRGVSGLIKACPDKYELLGSCADAKGVIQFLGTEIPDVIVTDICMPNQDGLELIHYLKHRYHNLDFIILSGYGEFEYAKKALQYQVFDFLLKPLRPEKLYEALDGVAEKRKSGSVTKAESLEDNCFFNLIRSQDKEIEEKNLKELGLYGQQGEHCVGILDLGGLSEESRKDIKLREVWKEAAIQTPAYIFTCFRYQIVFIWEGVPALETLEQALAALEQLIGARVYLGLSQKMAGDQCLKLMYFQALDAVKQHIYGSDDRLYRYEQLIGNEKMTFPDELCEHLLSAIRMGSMDRTQHLVKKLLGYYGKNKCPMLILKQHLQLLQSRIAMLADELGMDQEQVKQLENYVKNIEEVSCFSEIEGLWREKLCQMAQETAAAAERKMNSFYLDQILVYIQKNYDQNISLESVAESVNLSVGYLGNYFKQKMGMNFTDYLTQIRIEKAKELLLHSNEKIYQIAEKVGYQNSQYFVTAFKKKVGFTPMEYRKCLMEASTLYRS